jgi:hypothetical protein
MEARTSVSGPTNVLLTVKACEPFAATVSAKVVTTPAAAFTVTAVVASTSCVTVPLITLGRVTWNADTSRSPGISGGIGMTCDIFFIIYQYFYFEIIS